jgi:2-haloalkanoic acid dehalogenase type II
VGGAPIPTGGFRAVLFDYYFTLAEPQAVTPSAYPDLFVGAMSQLSTEEFQQARADFVASREPEPSLPFDGEVDPFHSFQMVWTDFWQGMLGFLGVPGDGEAYARARFHGHAAATLYDDVTAALSALRVGGWRLGVLSDADRGYLDANLACHGLNFDAAVCSEDLGCYKPHRSAFLAACDALGVEPSEALYVGDTPRTDIEGSRRAGLQSIWINRRSIAWPDDLDPPDLTITSLIDLPRAMSLLGEPTGIASAG